MNVWTYYLNESDESDLVLVELKVMKFLMVNWFVGHLIDLIKFNHGDNGEN